jgi:hypothetical protein
VVITLYIYGTKQILLKFNLINIESGDEEDIVVFYRIQVSTCHQEKRKKSVAHR